MRPWLKGYRVGGSSSVNGIVYVRDARAAALTARSPQLWENARPEHGRHVYEAVCGSDVGGEQLPLPL